MALRIERLARQMPEPEYLDKFFKAFGISFTLHVMAFVFMLIYSGLAPSIRKPARPTAYVVHLTDPGPLKKVSRPGVEKKRKRKKTVAKISRKDAAAPKKLAPVVGKTRLLEKKKTAKKKVIKSAGKTADSAVEETQAVKTGGVIDIKKFPYEWYLQIMESKIYRNWDTFSMDFYVSHPVSVTVYFRVGRSGNFRDMRVEQSSGDGEIDRSALEAVSRSAPLAPLPSGYIEDFLEVHFGFTLEPNR